MMQVDFMIIGAQKGGTTALRALLNGHSDIYFPEKKELHFFNNMNNFKGDGKPNYDLYHSEFSGRTNEKVIGEKTPGYFFFEEIPKRLYEYNQDLKLLVTLRNPIDRAYSNYQMLCRNKKLKETFIERLKMERKLDLHSAPKRHTESLIGRGYYTEQVRRLKRLFPDEQILFIKQDELLNKQDLVLRQVYDFLGVDKHLACEVKTKDIPPSRQYDAMDEECRVFLSNIYYHEVKQLEQELDWDCSDWLASMIINKT